MFKRTWIASTHTVPVRNVLLVTKDKNLWNVDMTISYLIEDTECFPLHTELISALVVEHARKVASQCKSIDIWTEMFRRSLYQTLVEETKKYSIHPYEIEKMERHVPSSLRKEKSSPHALLSVVLLSIGICSVACVLALCEYYHVQSFQVKTNTS